LPETKIVEPNSPTAREREKRARHDCAAQRGKRDVPERLPARRADGRGSLFERAAHRVEDGLDHAEGKRERDEDVGEDDRPSRKHQLYAVRREQPAERAVRSPQQQQGEPRARASALQS
jgi:hypothetical protein